MEHSQTYERIVARACVGRWRSIRIFAYVGYVCFASLWLTPILRAMFHPAMIALAIITTAVLVVWTRKYLHMEYEYSFVDSSFTVSKIFGKKKRKTMLEVDVHRMLLIVPATEEHFADASRLAPTKTLYALGTPDSENAILAVWDTDKDERVALYFESDPKTVSILRRFNPQACSRDLR